MSEPELLKIRIELEALITEREGMIAENKYQKARREFLHYLELEFVYYLQSDFQNVQSKITALLERMK